MSYTPENEKISEEDVEGACEALEALLAPIKERLKTRSDWSESHLEELRTLTHEIVDMQFRLRKMF